MIFDIATIVSVLSEVFTLLPGDLIATGTPEGVGFAMDPPGLLKPGDMVECEIENIGVLRNRIVAPTKMGANLWRPPRLAAEQFITPSVFV